MKTNIAMNSSGARRRRRQEEEFDAEEIHPEPSPAGATSRRRILLVDDDAGVRGSLGNLLVSEGFLVIPAVDGLQALELIKTTAIDLVLLDLNMPRKNGWEAFERLSADYPLVPVIIVTARPNQLFTALGAGAGALLEKPLNIPTLLHTMEQLLAEPAETRLARLAGRATDFHYSAAQPPSPG